MSHALRLSFLLFLTLSTACGDAHSSESPAPSDPLPALHAVANTAQGGRIVDERGREVLLRGVNVNAFVDYWQYDPDLFTTYPFTPEDADAIAAMGWTAVRLLVSWSRVEPAPGTYDEGYLDEVADAVAMLRTRGVYTLLDLHQDAWGPSLAAPPNEVCEGDSLPAGGWDGAPEWATFDGGAARCVSGPREFTPAVVAAWRAFFDDAPGPGGVGIQTRYVEMFAHLVSRFANEDAVFGYDLMNEPNVFDPADQAVLSRFYENALSAMRQAERSVGAPHRLFVFEPTAAWWLGFPAPPAFSHDDQVVYSPHIYQEGLGGGTIEGGFARAAGEAAESYGGAPVITGEWGADPARAASPDDDYFERHLAEQDRYRFGATLWTWREACGDPHKYEPSRQGMVPEVWGFFEVDCATNTITGPRTALFDVLKKLSVRFAPGPIASLRWAPDDTSLEASGDDAPPGNRLEIFVPVTDAAELEIEASGLGPIESAPWLDGTLLHGLAQGGAWSIRVRR